MVMEGRCEQQEETELRPTCLSPRRPFFPEPRLWGIVARIEGKFISRWMETEVVSYNNTNQFRAQATLNLQYRNLDYREIGTLRLHL